MATKKKQSPNAERGKRKNVDKRAGGKESRGGGKEMTKNKWSRSFGAT